eukprot:CAMPEP_0176295918 /NCGR_PEP_ID=MMETSP0121_2-20121125/57918_1 /TAXON_ID=160619 /ORGANISM="Kryptoperidinium foliaceum, Strain CCMP 1326" /LENGTH=307 /DNA_ID=CAMNT_0017637019 /DNA_START=116 /DNA_END=1038 /DNA_ORIENTATION=+
MPGSSSNVAQPQLVSWLRLIGRQIGRLPSPMFACTALKAAGGSAADIRNHGGGHQHLAAKAPELGRALDVAERGAAAVCDVSDRPCSELVVFPDGRQPVKVLLAFAFALIGVRVIGEWRVRNADRRRMHAATPGRRRVVDGLGGDAPSALGEVTGGHVRQASDGDIGILADVDACALLFVALLSAVEPSFAEGITAGALSGARRRAAQGDLDRSHRDFSARRAFCARAAVSTLLELAGRPAARGTGRRAVAHAPGEVASASGLTGNVLAELLASLSAAARHVVAWRNACQPRRERAPEGTKLPIGAQ